MKKLIEHELSNDGEDIDTLDEAMNSTYHQRAVRDLRGELAEQLDAIGIPGNELPPVD